MPYRASSTLILLASLSVCSACHIPPPTIREFDASSAIRAEQVCQGRITTAQFIVHSSPPLQGVLECNEQRGAVLVLTTEFHVRVRTITISKAGGIRDENSYLSTSSHSAETILSALSNALRSDVPSSRDDLIEVVTLLHET